MVSRKWLLIYHVWDWTHICIAYTKLFIWVYIYDCVRILYFLSYDRLILVRYWTVSKKVTYTVTGDLLGFQISSNASLGAPGLRPAETWRYWNRSVATPSCRPMYHIHQKNAFNKSTKKKHTYKRSTLSFCVLAMYVYIYIYVCSYILVCIYSRHMIFLTHSLSLLHQIQWHMSSVKGCTFDSCWSGPRLKSCPMLKSSGLVGFIHRQKSQTSQQIDSLHG